MAGADREDSRANSMVHIPSPPIRKETCTSPRCSTGECRNFGRSPAPIVRKSSDRNCGTRHPRARNVQRKVQVNRRFLASVAIVFWVAAAAAGQAKKWTPPHTPDGQPDLQGFWTNNSYTPLERPRNVNKEFYTQEE